jgi:capsular exopolysaccharide synthesis family protein
MSPRPSDTGEDPNDELFVVVDRSLDPRLVVYHDPRGPLAEQYRFFRTRLLAAPPATSVPGAPLQGPLQAMVLTSSRPSEGKSLSAANVALVLADLPSTTVCLVDADLRRPRQSRLFGVRSGPGLSDYLVEDIRSPDDLVIPTRLENLFLVPAGDQAMIPSAHFGSPRCLDLIHRLRERFHYVLFDTPPVGTFPDAAILASRLDGVILVIRMKKTPRKVVESSVDTLRRAGCHILSTLLTGVDTDKSWYEAYRSR